MRSAPDIYLLNTHIQPREARSRAAAPVNVASCLADPGKHARRRVIKIFTAEIARQDYQGSLLSGGAPIL